MQTLSAPPHTDARTNARIDGRSALITPAASDAAPSNNAAAATPASASAITLCAALLDADTLATGAHRLAAALAREGGFERVTIGLWHAGRVRLLAGSPVEPGHIAADLRQAMQGAMEEALEQGLTLAAPGELAEPDCIHLEQQLLQAQVGGALATVPLGRPGAPFAAVCVERRSQATPAFTAAELRRLEQWLVLAAPALRWLHEASEPWHARAKRDLLRRWAALRQPDQRNTRRLLGAALAAIAFVALVPLQDSVGGRARIEGAEQRVLSAPTDGFVKTAHVRPGDRVKAGDPLVDLLEADLRLERERWSSQLAQHENAYAAAMARSDRVAAATSMARAGEAQAQLSLVDEQLARGRVTAPFDATVIQGDLSQMIGAPVRQGDPLLTLATAGRHRVIVEVDEVDVARVEAGQSGTLALSSLPWNRDQLIVERIVPLAKAVDGRNVFEVEARLVAPHAELRPGLLGRAEIASGRAPLLWSWTRGALLRLRVALWSWLD